VLKTPPPPRSRRRRSIFGDTRAAAAVEFALLLPLMVTIFIGGNEISIALSIFRKVGHTSSTLGDLVAQASTVSTSEMTDVMSAATSVMTPWPSSGTKMIISAVKYKTSGGNKVCWSAAQNDTAWTVGSAPPITIPSGMIADGEEVIVTRVRYSYTSVFSSVMKDIWGTGAITLEDISYFRPRLSSTVVYNGQDCS